MITRKNRVATASLSSRSTTPNSSQVNQEKVSTSSARSTTLTSYHALGAEAAEHRWQRVVERCTAQLRTRAERGQPGSRALEHHRIDIDELHARARDRGEDR